MKMNAKHIQNSTLFAVWVLLNVILFISATAMNTWLLLNQVYFNVMFLYVLTQSLNLGRSKKPIVQIKYPVMAANLIYLIVLFGASLLFIVFFNQEAGARQRVITITLLHGIPLVVYLVVHAILSIDNIKTVKHLRKTQQDINYIETITHALHVLHEDFEGDKMVKKQLFALYEKVKYSQITTQPEVQAIEIQLAKAVDMLTQAIKENDTDTRDLLIAESEKIVKNQERTLKGM